MTVKTTGNVLSFPKRKGASVEEKRYLAPTYMAVMYQQYLNIKGFNSDDLNLTVKAAINSSQDTVSISQEVYDRVQLPVRDMYVTIGSHYFPEAYWGLTTTEILKGTRDV